MGVRRVADDRGVPIELLTDDIEALVARDDVDIVVELMGPVEPARKADPRGAGTAASRSSPPTRR